MKILTIGDIHGFDTWKQALNYYRPTEEKTLIDKFDKIIFVGDYVDEFELSNITIYNNFLDIIDLKIKFPDKVVLLWGNHDVQYFIPGNTCSGFRQNMYFQLNLLFTKNEHLFQLAYQYKNYLWTHAGIHRGWYKFNIEQQKYVIRDGEKLEYLEIDKSGNIADILNFCFVTRHEPIFDVGWARGGYKKVGGPLWADKNETYKKPLEGYHQIVGHTHIEKIKHYNKYKGDTSITYVDCLNIKNDYNENFYILEIEY